MGINDVVHFEFLDPPDEELVETSIEQLTYLGAIDKEGLLTPIGNLMSHFPLSPFLSRVLIASAETGCSAEVLKIVALLSVEEIFVHPRAESEVAKAQKRHKKFFDSSGDHITYLNIFNSWS